MDIRGREIGWKYRRNKVEIGLKYGSSGLGYNGNWILIDIRYW